MGFTLYVKEINKHRTNCKKCGRVILPGEPVVVGEKHNSKLDNTCMLGAYETSNGWYSLLCRKCSTKLGIQGVERTYVR